jgi:hypothetical protein
MRPDDRCGAWRRRNAPADSYEQSGVLALEPCQHRRLVGTLGEQEEDEHTAQR